MTGKINWQRVQVGLCISIFVLVMAMRFIIVWHTKHLTVLDVILSTVLIAFIYLIYLTIYAAYKNKHFQSILKNGEKTEGMITHIKEHVFRPDAKPYTAARTVEIEFHYKDASGNEYVSREKDVQPLQGGSKKIGDVIGVRYDKKNPAIAYSDSAIGRYLYEQYYR